jgi:hypothetical protein
MNAFEAVLLMVFSGSFFASVLVIAALIISGRED